ncbi:MAG: sulfatase-like hydrolase/transferase, partial [Anaerolineae bacterium]|jgi:arylsulfatase A-like enzyme|nr:sulfatase-like hydrolase/transferase [Anaerolineae bacterium]
MKKPNILFLFTDDQRYDTINTLNNPHIYTPNMDRLVQRGTAFTHAHIMGGTSGAVCMPSRAMVMTGRTLFNIDDMGQTIPEDHTMMPVWLREHGGYHTFGIGKWHNSREAFARGFDDGAHIFFGGMNDHWNVPTYDFDPTGQYAEGQWNIDPGYHSTEKFADAAVKFINGYDRKNPFFLYVAFMAPHDPRTMPARFLEMYDPDKIEIPANFQPMHPFDNGELYVRDELLAEHPRNQREICSHIADYYAMVTHLDEHIGRVLDALENSGQMENTIIVLAGDNGLAVGRHGLMGKQNLYDHSVRVPLIFAGPEIPQGKTTDELVYLVDIFPTLCNFAGLAVPETVNGIDLTQTIREDAPARQELYLAYTHVQRAVRTRTHKLIEYVVDGQRTTQLFDLLNDPDEIHDLSQAADHQKLIKKLRKTLLQEREVLKDTRERESSFWKGYMK